MFTCRKVVCREIALPFYIFKTPKLSRKRVIFSKLPYSKFLVIQMLAGQLGRKNNHVIAKCGVAMYQFDQLSNWYIATPHLAIT